ncbi:acyltransferase [Proteus mirabilis]|uniref:acyltransferase n=1 Tax=Proteus mirabilis TaxID=584 RepID=UPI0023F96918|nr:acyltransferase [Proteus mirabilis]MDF7212587.1 acyltransferase [Proteus mirabilis]MDF7396603.1 acyltransferase [Proteus mirabilis]
MSFYTQEQLLKIGFKSIGKNCKISSKASIYRPEEIEIGNNCRIDDFVILSGKIYLGNNIHIAAFCNLSAGQCSILFEDFSGLAYGCHVFTGTDDYSGRTMTNPTVPLKYKGLKEKNIIIGRHSIIGTNSIIMPGVNIAEGTAVGALSMVTKSTKPWGIYFGNPAKRIKERKQDLLLLESEYLKNEHD